MVKQNEKVRKNIQMFENINTLYCWTSAFKIKQPYLSHIYIYVHTKISK